MSWEVDAALFSHLLNARNQQFTELWTGISTTENLFSWSCSYCKLTSSSVRGSSESFWSRSSSFARSSDTFHIKYILLKQFNHRDFIKKSSYFHSTRMQHTKLVFLLLSDCTFFLCLEKWEKTVMENWPTQHNAEYFQYPFVLRRFVS